MNITECVTSDDYSRFVRLFLAFFIIIFASSCLEGVNGQKSGRPIGTQQIVLNAFPVAVFGNACEFVDIEALFNELLTPDGTTIQVGLTGSTLPFNLRGCTAFFDPVVVDGMADVEYLSPPFVGVGGLGFVDVAVTSTLQSGLSSSNFAPVVIQGVGIVSITGPDMDMIMSDPDVFATIVVDTVGIPPGTIVNFQVTNTSCGFLSNPTPVLGSVFEGIAIVQYNPFEGTECTQTVIATIVLPDPPTKDPDCDSIPIGDRTIQDSVTFDQIFTPLPTPTPTPTPSPTPIPSPTPTPMPPPVIEVAVLSDMIAPEESTIVTATTNTGPNTDVCCDIPIQSDPESFLTIGGTSTPPAVCAQTNINGELFAILTGGNVETLQTIQVRCCIDSDTTPSACDLEEPQASVFVDIEPSGVSQMIQITADPADVIGGGMTILSATTTPPVPGGTPICFEIEENSTPPSTFLIPGPPFCVDAASNGQALIGLEAGEVVMERTIVIKGCIGEGLPAGCDPLEPSGFVTVTIMPAAPPPPPPVQSIDVTAFNGIIEPDGSTIITATTTNAPPATPVCCDIPIQSDPMSLLGFPPAAPPDCGSTDINGDFFTVLTGGNVVTLQTIQVRCCIDSNTIPNACDPEEPQDSVFVDIDPEGVPPPIELSAQPSVIPPGGQSTITAMTAPPVPANTNICFEIVVDSNPTSDLVDAATDCALASSLGEAVIGLVGGNVMTQQSVTVRGCIDISGNPDDCDDVDPSGFVTVVISPPTPTPTPAPTPPPVPAITIQATSSLVPPNGNTFINVITNQVAGTELCVQILVDGTGAATIMGNFGLPPVGTGCALADAGGDAIGVINLMIPGTALSGQQISLQGCIDTAMNDMCDGADPLSSVIFVTVP